MRNFFLLAITFPLICLTACAEKIDFQPQTANTEEETAATQEASRSTNRVVYSNESYALEHGYLHTLELPDGTFEQRLVLSADGVKRGDDLEGASEFVIEFLFISPTPDPVGRYSKSITTGNGLERVGANHTYQLMHGLPELISNGYDFKSGWLAIAQDANGYFVDFKVNWPNHNNCVTQGEFLGQFSVLPPATLIDKRAGDFAGTRELTFDNTTLPISGAYLKEFTKLHEVCPGQTEVSYYTTLRLPTESLTVEGDKLTGVSDMITLEVPLYLTRTSTSLHQLGDWFYTFNKGYFERSRQHIYRTAAVWHTGMDAETGQATSSLSGNGGEAVILVEEDQIHLSLKFTMDGRKAISATYSGPYTQLSEL